MAHQINTSGGGGGDDGGQAKHSADFLQYFQNQLVASGHAAGGHPLMPPPMYPQDPAVMAAMFGGAIPSPAGVNMAALHSAFMYSPLLNAQYFGALNPAAAAISQHNLLMQHQQQQQQSQESIKSGLMTDDTKTTSKKKNPKKKKAGNSKPGIVQNDEANITALREDQLATCNGSHDDVNAVQQEAAPKVRIMQDVLGCFS